MLCSSLRPSWQRLDVITFLSAEAFKRGYRPPVNLINASHLYSTFLLLFFVAVNEKKYLQAYFRESSGMKSSHASVSTDVELQLNRYLLATEDYIDTNMCCFVQDEDKNIFSGDEMKDLESNYYLFSLPVFLIQ